MQDAVSDLLLLFLLASSVFYALFQLLCDKTDLIASVSAIARAFPLYTRKSSAGCSKRDVTVEIVLMGNDTSLTDQDIAVS